MQVEFYSLLEDAPELGSDAETIVSRARFYTVLEGRQAVGEVEYRRSPDLDIWEGQGNVRLLSWGGPALDPSSLAHAAWGYSGCAWGRARGARATRGLGGASARCSGTGWRWR